MSRSRKITDTVVNSWVLSGARVACGPLKAERLDLQIQSGEIAAIRPSASPRSEALVLDLRGCLILPGLINAHDHLEFNLFPRLGRGPYPNAGAWARDIHHPERSPIREHLRVPLGARLHWGGIKNLLSGVTTVCHHNPYDSRVFSRSFAVRVPRRLGWAHSLEFCPDLVRRFRHTPPGWPFVIHLGEAVDRPGSEEIGRLERLGALGNRTVLVHGVALGLGGLRLAQARGASLVWCPSSNMFILGRTLRRIAFESGIPIALGTDSALSGQGDLLQELRLARQVARLPASRLYEMVTREAARIMRLTEGEGSLIEGGAADLLVVKDRGMTPASTLLKLRTGEMEMVFVRGELKLVSPESLRQVAALSPTLYPLVVTGRSKRQVFVAVDLPRLFDEVEPVLRSVVLAHKKLQRFS